MTIFEEFYGNLRVKDEQSVRNELEKLVTSASFNNWRNGTFEPASGFWKAINEIAEKFGYEKPYRL